jgi:hypothetical protein
MKEQRELSPDQIVAVAIAHDYINEEIKRDGSPPSLNDTMDFVRQGYNQEAKELCQTIGAGLRTEKAVKAAVGLFALLVSRRNRRGPIL